MKKELGKREKAGSIWIIRKKTETEAIMGDSYI